MGREKIVRKNMQYDREKIVDAVEMVKAGCPIRKAAKLHGIPNSTLREKVMAKYSRHSPGKSPVLTRTEEQRIVEWLLAKAKAGFPVNTKRLVACVAHYLQKSERPNPFKNGIPGRKWIKSFIKRHPEISRRVPSVLPKHRAAVSEPQIRSWFSEIRRYFEEEGLSNVLKIPEQIFNLDETAVRTIPTKEIVLAGSGQKYVHAKVGNSDRESYTALFCGNAAGQLAPTLMIYPYKSRMPQEIWQRLPEGWAAGKTESGWMNRDTFYLFLKDVFYPWLVQVKIPFPVIVFLDGHKSHVSPKTTEFCTEKNIILICLPPNSTQVTQPLDVSFFRPLKNFWDQVLVEWRIENNGEMLPRKEIAPLLKQAVDRMVNLQSTLLNGFRRCGLYPFDPDAVNYSSLIGNRTETLSTQAEMPTITDTREPEVDLNDVHFVERLESFLSPDQLKIFESCRSLGEWHGALIDTSLYEVWTKAKGSLDEPSIPITDSVFHGFDDVSAEETTKQLTSQTMTSSVDSNSVKENHASPDAFDASFGMPSVSRSTPAKRRHEKLSPPSVATSQGYRLYMEKLENAKKNVEMEKQKKRDERQKKKELKVLSKQQAKKQKKN